MKFNRLYEPDFTTPATHSFDWNDKSDAMLTLLNKRIERYGGIRRYYADAIKEARPSMVLNKANTERTKRSILINNWSKFSITELADMLNISRDTVRVWSLELGLTNKSPVYLKRQFKQTVWVLNLETGIYYENMAGAGRSIGVSKVKIRRQLTGVFRNRTDLRIV